jgi:hypothetical protein
MSSRRTFIDVAAALRSAREHSTCIEHAHGVDDAAQAIAHAFGRENRAFERQLFLRNAGVPDRSKEKLDRLVTGYGSGAPAPSAEFTFFPGVKRTMHGDALPRLHPIRCNCGECKPRRTSP